MQQIGVWHIADSGPQKLSESKINLEKELEEWIEQDPNLLETGLVIVGRQLRLESGKLGLLALDLQANFVVIEIKKGTVNRDTLIQAIDYAASIKKIADDEIIARINDYLSKMSRKSSLNSLVKKLGCDADSLTDAKKNIRLLIVGTGKQYGLERIAGFLAEFQIPISVVSYVVFEVARGQRVLIRELDEKEVVQSPTASTITLDRLCEMADQNGVGESFRIIRKAAEAHGLYPHLWPKSVMYTSPENRSRMLFTVWTKPRKGLLKTFIGNAAFAEFYPVTRTEAAQFLGKRGYRDMKSADAKTFVKGLDRLFKRIEEKAE